MQTSFHTATLGDMSVVDAVDTLLKVGYDSVELNAETLPWTGAHVGPDTPDDVRAELKARGRISSIAAHRDGLASTDEAKRHEAVEWTVGCAQLAVDIGVGIIHVIPGDQPDVGASADATGDPGDLDAFVDSLQEVVQRSSELGVIVALEPIVNQLVETTDQALTVLDRVPGLKISFDPSHLQVTTGDVIDAARRLGPHTVIAAIKDATGTPDDFKFLAQGHGDIDFPAMVAALRDEGFDGALVVEHEAHLFGDDRGPDVVVRQSLLGARQLAYS